MRPTIRNIANEIGCSVTTVSLVLNGKAENVSDELKTKIIESAKRLKYRPNRIAAALVTGKTQTLGLIIPDNRNLFFATILHYMQFEANMAGYQVITGISSEMLNKDIEFIETLMSLYVDGIIIVRSNPPTFEENQKFEAFLSSLHIPIVAIDRIINVENVPTFVINNLQGGYIATKHLIENGHRTIGCYSGPLHISSAQLRLEGYKAALKEHGIDYDPDLVFEGNYQIYGGPEPFQFFQKRRVTAIFSHNDMQAYNLYRYIKLAERRIPDDFAIVGFDNLVLSSIITPGLTTIEAPVEKMMQDAIACLISMIDSNRCPTAEQFHVVEYDPVLVSRESVISLK
jgi:LacI family transcriptional regulator